MLFLPEFCIVVPQTDMVAFGKKLKERQIEEWQGYASYEHFDSNQIQFSVKS